MRTLPTVAAKSHAFVRHASGALPARGGGGPVSSAAASSLEGVAEGGGESVESGGKAGIDDSNVGVQPKFSTRKGRVLSDLDRLDVETRYTQLSPQRFRVQGVSVDHRAPRSSRLENDRLRERGDPGGVKLEGGGEEALGKGNRHRDDPVFLVLWPPQFGVAQDEPSRGEGRVRLLFCPPHSRRRSAGGLRPRLIHELPGLGPGV